MIETFEGRIGGGKTYSAVERMLLHWLAGGVVYTNVDINWQNVKEYMHRKFEVELDDRQFVRFEDEQVSRFWEHMPWKDAKRIGLKLLAVIDEADVWLGNQTTGVKIDVDIFNFFKQSRKMGIDVILITQALKNLHSVIARLNQHVWRFRDMERWRIEGLGITWPLKQILQVCYDYNGKTVLQKAYRPKSTEIFKLYNTDALYAPFQSLAQLDGPPIQVKRFGKKKVEVPTWAIGAAAVVLVLALMI